LGYLSFRLILGSESYVCEDVIVMGMFWIAIVLVVAIILGNLMILFRTAKKPKIPDSVKPKPYKDDDENW
jgi:hypothetical protein